MCDHRTDAASAKDVAFGARDGECRLDALGLAFERRQLGGADAEQAHRETPHFAAQSSARTERRNASAVETDPPAEKEIRRHATSGAQAGARTSGKRERPEAPSAFQWPATSQPPSRWCCACSAGWASTASTPARSPSPGAGSPALPRTAWTWTGPHCRRRCPRPTQRGSHAAVRRPTSSHVRSSRPTDPAQTEFSTGRQSRCPEAASGSGKKSLLTSDGFRSNRRNGVLIA